MRGGCRGVRGGCLEGGMGRREMGVGVAAGDEVGVWGCGDGGMGSQQEMGMWGCGDGVPPGNGDVGSQQEMGM